MLLFFYICIYTHLYVCLQYYSHVVHTLSKLVISNNTVIPTRNQYNTEHTLVKKTDCFIQPTVKLIFIPLEISMNFLNTHFELTFHQLIFR